MKKAIWLFPVLLFVIGLFAGKAISQKQHPNGQAAKSQYLTSLIGQRCRVQFKRNALGSGTSIPVPPTTDNQDGADVSMTGTLRLVEKEAIVLDNDYEGNCWIPKDAILMIIDEEP